MNQNKKGNYQKSHNRANSYSRSRSRSDSRSPGVRNKSRALDKSQSDKRYATKNNDSGKSEKFVWGKKIEEQRKKEIDPRSREEEERNKKVEMQREIEKVQNRRQVREKEQFATGQQKIKAEKETEEEAYKKWLAQEEKFHVEQAKLRSEIRIKEGREKPVDYLVKILLIHRSKFDYDPSQEREIRKPYILLTRLTREELEDLVKDIQEQAKIELNDYYKKFWDEVSLLVEDRIKAIDLARAPPVKGRSAAHMGEEFEKEVNEMISDKNLNELIELEKEIHETLDCPSDFKIDVEYWENVLKKLRVRKAKAFLEDMGNKFVENYKPGDTKKHYASSSMSVHINTGDLSPRLLDFDRHFENLVITAAEDIEALNEERGNILMTELQKSVNQQKKDNKRKGKESTEIEQEDEETEEQKEQNKRDGKEEQEFNEVAILTEQHYDWEGKYVPRKPQYFNRVKIGYEWNKYNQTHYDQDNPPPKVIQGYKFNIFYPDLIDYTKAPEFHLEPTDNPDYCNIRFHAGPPYQDIAFKIWNKEWDFSDRQGFKCIFEGAILYLYFDFRKPRYRR